MNLAELKVGQKAKVQVVGGEGQLRRRLLEMGLIPGTVVEMQEPAPMGDPLCIRLRNYYLTLRIAEAEKIDILSVSSGAAANVGVNAQ